MSHIAKIIALVLMINWPTSVLAQTTSQPRLRVVVRTSEGKGVSGIAVRLYQVSGIDEAISLKVQGQTDSNGILDYQVTAWQVGEYQVRLAAGTSAYSVASDDEQSRSVPPLSFRLAKSGDEWLMLILEPNGQVTPDFSYSLTSLPRPLRGLPATPRPASWSSVLTKRGLPVNLPAPFAATPTSQVVAESSGPQAVPLPGLAAPAAPTDNKAGYLTAAVAVLFFGWWWRRNKVNKQRKKEKQ